MELVPKYLRDLPHDKDYHVFVCYESTTVDVVRKLVKSLESMGIKCCYYERDFPAGQSVNVSINDAIKKSLHMVIVITENFQGSVYCKDEVDQALYLRMQGKYNLIPIKIEPCSVPECLQHIAYIDAEDDIDIAHTKIIDAMAKKELQESLRDVKNGESQQFKVLPFKPSRFSLTRYKLIFNETDKKKMWNNQFELPADLLDDIANKANNSLLFEYLHIWNHMQLFVASIILLLSIILFIVFLGVLSQAKPTKQNELPTAGYILIIGISSLLISWITGSYLVCSHSSRKKGSYSVYHQALRLLKYKIWDMSKQTCNQTGIIFFLTVPVSPHYPSEISVHFMRYNFKPCKTYFMRKLDIDDDLRKVCKETETKEECTDRLFDNFLRRSSFQLEVACKQQRHKMANGAKCVCLLVEEWLKDTDNRQQ